LKEEIFQDCLKYYKESDGHTKFWPDLCEKWGYPPGDKLRDDFKRERRRRGVPSRNDVTFESIPRINKSPKILVFDIENSYIEVASWGINKQYINRGQILNDWFMLSYAAKWLYDEKIYSGVLTSKEAMKKSDKRICEEMYELLNDADICITYNGNGYDIPKINTRFIINGIQPPTPYKSIDVFQTISRQFAFTSKSMDYVNYSLELERKKETEGMSLWIRAVSGEENALKDMNLYNIQDVVALQEQYLVVRPWIKNHPNIGLWHESKEPMCGFCGSADIEYVSNLYSTPAGLYKSFRCKDCHAIGRTQEQYLSKEKRKSMGRNI
jgi:hypothetical protein